MSKLRKNKQRLLKFLLPFPGVMEISTFYTSFSESQNNRPVELNWKILVKVKVWTFSRWFSFGRFDYNEAETSHDLFECSHWRKMYSTGLLFCDSLKEVYNVKISITPGKGGRNLGCLCISLILNFGHIPDFK